MRFNENIAVSTEKVLLVPYDAHHVPRYHQWMEDPAIREATASERLSLDEEYENQASWRESPDKLTFILCEPLLPQDPAPIVVAGVDDAPTKMIGDINLFLTPWDDDEDEQQGQEPEKGEKTYYTAEVDIMIADSSHRGKGIGRAAVSTFLVFVRRHLDAILAEYANADNTATTTTPTSTPALREVVAKINASNTGSIALFKSLGFVKKGDVNYFGEIRMVLADFEFASKGNGGKKTWEAAREGMYWECAFDRSRLGTDSTG
ncbi:GNAT domain-containing protein [Hypoxylon trugodes]|uniref:GNAT domain-containing protein n=1 Tax=Hypoxylon trugodes TaxID=326681 RepID=UPI00219D59DD|nr:GNAT domain-containing protein [Hypoxylon trugodes]KAI1391470.1 GNAT domain-containing protein [Hypoxylon trugodes]